MQLKDAEKVSCVKCEPSHSGRLKATLCNHLITGFKSYDATLTFNEVNGSSIISTLRSVCFFLHYVTLWFGFDHLREVCNALHHQMFFSDVLIGSGADVMSELELSKQAMKPGSMDIMAEAKRMLTEEDNNVKNVKMQELF